MIDNEHTLHTACLALGSNLGDKNTNLQVARKLIADKIGNLSAVSSAYETQPWGFESENLFLNQVVSVETPLNPLDLLHATQTIEKEMGRTQKSQNGYRDRIIDIDLILYDDLIYTSEELELPHPLFHRRRFVLEPLNEIQPELVHPVLHKTIKELVDCQES
jgi:2-amino-4-hydroxy-6-hydroxymethyldihydropteridine diphosphokinase